MMWTSIQTTLILFLMAGTPILASPILANAIQDTALLVSKLPDHQTAKLVKDAQPPAPLITTTTELKPTTTTNAPGSKETGSKKPGSKEPSSKEPDSKEPDSKEPGSKEPDSKEPGSKEAGSKPTSSIPTGNATACSPEIQALASGIMANIADQRNEQTALTSIGTILEASPVDTSKFDTAKQSLLDLVNKGITIREKNQKIAPKGNAAIAGLATVAKAQEDELKLAKSLSASDVKTSKEKVETLKKDFSGGIEQNKKNLAAATQGCKMPKTPKETSKAPKV